MGNVATLAEQAAFTAFSYTEMYNMLAAITEVEKSGKLSCDFTAIKKQLESGIKSAIRTYERNNDNDEE